MTTNYCGYLFNFFCPCKYIVKYCSFCYYPPLNGLKVCSVYPGVNFDKNAKRCCVFVLMLMLMLMLIRNRHHLLMKKGVSFLSLMSEGMGDGERQRKDEQRALLPDCSEA